jgi:hypothetical protein
MGGNDGKPASDGGFLRKSWIFNDFPQLPCLADDVSLLENDVSLLVSGVSLLVNDVLQ